MSAKPADPWIGGPCPVCGDPLVEKDGMWACEAGVEHECVPGPDGDCIVWLVDVGCDRCGWDAGEDNADPRSTVERIRAWRDLMEDVEG